MSMERLFINLVKESKTAIDLITRQIRDEVLSQPLAEEQKNIDKIPNIIFQLSLKSKCQYLILSIQKFNAVIYYHIQDYIKSVNLLKQVKNFSQYYNFLTLKMKAYYHIGRNFIKLKKYQVALKYLVKLLRMSWMLNDKNYELKAYDQM